MLPLLPPSPPYPLLPTLSSHLSSHPLLQSGYLQSDSQVDLLYTVLVGKRDSILTNGFLPDHRKKPTNKTPFMLSVHFQAGRRALVGMRWSTRVLNVHSCVC